MKIYPHHVVSTPYWKPVSAHLSELLEDEWSAEPLPSVDISKGPLTDFVVWVEVISCLDHVHLAPEKAVISQAQKCLLLRNGGAEILGIQREETEINMELIRKILFSLLPQGLLEQQS